MRLILNLVILAAATVTLMVLVAVIAQIPLETVAGSLLIAEIATAATLAAVAIARRAGRQRWTPETPRRTHRDRLPVPRVDAEIIEPQVQPHRPQCPQIEAPRREVEVQ